MKKKKSPVWLRSSFSASHEALGRVGLLRISLSCLMGVLMLPSGSFMGGSVSGYDDVSGALSPISGIE